MDGVARSCYNPDLIVWNGAAEQNTNFATGFWHSPPTYRALLQILSFLCNYMKKQK